MLSRMDVKLSDMQTKQMEMDIKFSTMQKKQRGIDHELKRLVQKMGGARADEADAEEGDGADRKRLKERFKKSLMLDEGPLADMPQAASAWMELIFGIGAPDRLRGKEGSR